MQFSVSALCLVFPCLQRYSPGGGNVGLAWRLAAESCEMVCVCVCTCVVWDKLMCYVFKRGHYVLCRRWKFNIGPALKVSLLREL